MRSDTRKTSPWILGGTAAVMVLASASAQAQTTTAEAEEIATAIKRYIDDRILAPTPELSLDLDGSIAVRAAGDRYEGEIPAGRLLVEMDHDDIVVFDFAEPFRFQLRPTERGWYDTTFTVPSSVRISVEQEPEAAVTVNIGRQSGAMIYAPEYETSVDADITWSEITMLVANTPGELSIAELAFLQQSDERAEGVFDSDFSLDMSGLRVSVPQEDVLVELDAAGLFGSVVGIDYPALLPFSIALNDLAPRLEEDPDNPALYEELRLLIAETPTILADLQGTYFIEGLLVDSPDFTVALDEATAGGALTGLDTDRATIGVSLNISGLDIEPPIPFANLLPSDTGYDISIVDLPTEVVLSWLDELLATIQTMDPEDAIEASLLPLYGQIAASGAFFEIADIHYEAEAGAFAVGGEVTPDTSAMFGVTAAVELMVIDMARLIEAMHSLPDFGDEAAAGFTVIQALGSREVNDQGEPVHIYDFEVTRDGAMTLNGNDLGPLMQQMR